MTRMGCRDRGPTRTRRRARAAAAAAFKLAVGQPLACSPQPPPARAPPSLPSLRFRFRVGHGPGRAGKPPPGPPSAAGQAAPRRPRAGYNFKLGRPRLTRSRRQPRRRLGGSRRGGRRGPARADSEAAVTVRLGWHVGTDGTIGTRRSRPRGLRVTRLRVMPVAGRPAIRRRIVCAAACAAPGAARRPARPEHESETRQAALGGFPT
jgi:hypothetical protein